MNLEPALQTYIAESLEQLEEMERVLLELEDDGEQSQDKLDEIFRAAHTIKGSAGLFGLDDIVEFTHGVESLLDLMREGKVKSSEDIISLLISSRDHINALVEKLAAGDEEENESLKSEGNTLSKRLQHFIDEALGKDEVSGEEDAAGSLVEAEVIPGVSPVERMEHGEAVENENWHISLRFPPDVLREGMDPLSFLYYLETIGTINHIVTLDEALPSANEMDVETCYLGFEINFKSDADKETIEDVFEFVRDESFIRIIPPRSRIAFYLELLDALPDTEMRLGDMLQMCGSLTSAELERALAMQKTMREKSVDLPLGNIIVEAGMTETPVLNAAIAKQSKVRENTFREKQSVRVDAEKLDELINLVGELVIAGAGTALNAGASGNTVLTESVSSLNGLVEQVRDSALRLRMVQVGATFTRFRRVVRDVSLELGKDIDLIITGAETELDKTVIEKIADPLMHLVRNSMDHGIEPSDLRLAQGKSSTGMLKLNAYHDSGSVVIEVSDDGAGLNKEKIKQKAIEKGIIEEDQVLDDQDIYNLIFAAGFSTADSVSNLSGRGVGMDVVKSNIAALRGTVELESTPGKGSKFSIRLPLTLAIIDGFQVAVNEASFVIPLDMVLECVELDEFNEVANKPNYMNLRGEVLPFIRLRNLFSLSGQPLRRENVVVVQYGGKKAGLVVDDLIGEFQTVIKPLGEIFNHLQGVGGSTILGSGEVALILDVPGLIQQMSAPDISRTATAA